MKSEALGRIRTLRQVKTSLERAREQGFKTTSGLFRMAEEPAPVPPGSDRELQIVLSKEKKRFNSFEASIQRSRSRLLKSRERLALKLNRNRALMKLRLELQQARWKGDAQPPPTTPGQRKTFQSVDLNY